MNGPDFFSLFMLIGMLMLGLFGCIVTAAVWFFFGWRKKFRALQFASALPLGIGVFIIMPLLLLLLGLVVWWLLADWNAGNPVPKSAADHELLRVRSATNAPMAERAADWWTSTNSPCIALWDDGGTPMANQPRFVLFAAWSDGGFVRRRNDKLFEGQMSQLELRDLMEGVQKAGYFSDFGSSLINNYGLVRSDGAARCLAIMRNGKLVRRYYDGHTDFQNLGPHADPSKQQMEAFVQMWQRVLGGIDSVPPSEVGDYHGERELKYPGSW